MFGHAAPVIPGRTPGAPAPGGFAPPQQQGFAAPQPGQPARPAGPQGATIMGGPPNMQPPAQPGRPPGMGGPPPGQQPYGAPPGQPNFGGPPQQGFGGGPPQMPGQPPMGGQPGFGPPPGQPGFGPPPGQPPMGGQPGFGPPPGQPPMGGQPYGQPPMGGQPGFGPPPGQPGFGPPPGQPPMGGQPGFGPPPGQPPMGGPQPGFGPPPGGPQPGYQPPGPQPGFGPPPGQPQPGFPPPQAAYPAAGGFGVAPQQDLPGPIDNIARGLPQSAPGTILGIPVARMLEPGLQRTVLFLAGIALLASIVVPVSISPLRFPFQGPFWEGILFPAIVGGGYLLVAAAPAEMRQKLPPIVIQWMPFGLALWGVYSFFGPIYFGGGMGTFAYIFLVFGLLSRIMKPNDATARVVIGIGAGLMVFTLLNAISNLTFSGIFPMIASLLNLLVSALGVLCVTMVLPPQKVPAPLRALDALGPLICAVLLLWPVVLTLLIFVDGLIGGNIVGNLLVFARFLLYLVAFIGVLLMNSPPVYDQVTGVPVLRRSPVGTLAMLLVPLFGVYWIVETKEYLKKKTGMDLPSGWWLAVPLYGPIMFLWRWTMAYEKATGEKQMTMFLIMMFISPFGIWKAQTKFNEMEGINPNAPRPAAPPPGGGYPPQGGGYPPPGGGYPPQGGGYPPPGGGYPPQGGGYPPPGGGYPA